jgi:hypothetical protein
MTDAEIVARQKNELARAEYVVKAQMAEIDRLRAEIDRLTAWINGDADALTTLQSVYLDPEQSAANRIKAASSAIGFERPKLVVQGYANVTSLAQRLDQGRQPRVIEHQADG